MLMKTGHVSVSNCSSFSSLSSFFYPVYYLSVSFFLLFHIRHYYYYYYYYYYFNLLVFISVPPSCYYPSTSCYPFCSNIAPKTCYCSRMPRSYIPLLIAYIRYSMRIITWNVAVHFICLAPRVSFFSCDGMTLLTTWVLPRGIVISKGTLLSVDKKKKKETSFYSM